jgi:hypothetical protein
MLVPVSRRRHPLISTVLCVTTLWDCPKPGCPRTENAPKELSVEQAVSDQPIGPGQPAIMRVEDVVEFLKLPSVQTVHSWNKKGVGPPYFWAGHQMRYRRREGEVVNNQLMTATRKNKRATRSVERTWRVRRTGGPITPSTSRYSPSPECSPPAADPVGASSGPPALRCGSTLALSPRWSCLMTPDRGITSAVSRQSWSVSVSHWRHGEEWSNENPICAIANPERRRTRIDGHVTRWQKTAFNALV